MDTCGPIPRVALWVDGRVTTAAPQQAGARADDAASLAARLLEGAGRRAAELTGIGVTTGPGSYTGVRIGLALVRGLSLVDRLPVVGMGTLDLLAEAAPVTDVRVCSVLDAGGAKLYVAVLARQEHGWHEVVPPRVIGRPDLTTFADDEAGAAVLVRSEDEGELACDRRLIAVPGVVRITALAEVTARRLKGGDATSADRVLPLYVGATGARPNRNKVVTAGFADE